MSTNFPVTISPGLRLATDIKIQDLDRARESLKSRYKTTADNEDGILKRLEALLGLIKDLNLRLEEGQDIAPLSKFVDQAQNDCLVSHEKLERLEKKLKSQLEKYGNRLEVSALHVEILKEAMSAAVSKEDMIDEAMEKVALEDGFEMVGYPLENVVKNFENSNFSSTSVDEEPILDYLNALFDNDNGKKLQEMRKMFSSYGDHTIQSCEVDYAQVTWCIEDLLKNELISPEKKSTLREYLQSPSAIKELTEILGVKSIRHWNFRDIEKEVPIAVHQNADGGYFITVDEDIIDMLFLHNLAAGWSSRFKIIAEKIWPGNKCLSNEEMWKMEYWLQNAHYKHSCSPPLSTWTPSPPPPPPLEPIPLIPPMPSMSPIHMFPPPPGTLTYPHSFCREVPYYHSNSEYEPPPPPPGYNVCLNNRRYTEYKEHFLLGNLPIRNRSRDSVGGKKMQSQLLKTLATEGKLRLAFDGKVSNVMADFAFCKNPIPHQTILAVLKFMGIPQQWLDVFERFLRAPLDMSPVIGGDTGNHIRTCTSGIHLGHGMEGFFREAVLFFLDFAVHKQTDGYLYRLRDKAYFLGKDTQVESVRREFGRFEEAMHISAYLGDISEEPFGFVRLTASGKEVTHTLIDTRIEAYARRVKRKLACCDTVIEWIRTWNNTMGGYAHHLFGPLANVFGKSHLDRVTQAYNRMHKIVLDERDLTTHVKNLLTIHLNRPLTEPALCLEAIIYLPCEFGGLGIMNPYITLNNARKVEENPSSIIEKFKESERKYYEYTKANFEGMTPTAKANKLNDIFDNDKDLIAASLGTETDPTIFPPFEAITFARESYRYFNLSPLHPPDDRTCVPTPDLDRMYTELMAEQNDYVFVQAKRFPRGRRVPPRHRILKKDRYLLLMYEDECFEKYGGCEIWEMDRVPRELLERVRGELSNV